MAGYNCFGGCSAYLQQRQAALLGSPSVRVQQCPLEEKDSSAVRVSPGIGFLNPLFQETGCFCAAVHTCTQGTSLSTALVSLPLNRPFRSPHLVWADTWVDSSSRDMCSQSPDSRQPTVQPQYPQSLTGFHSLGNIVRFWLPATVLGMNTQQPSCNCISLR